MLLYPSMGDLVEKYGSPYAIVNMVSNRAREIATENEKEHIVCNEKTVSIALREMSEASLVEDEEPAEEESEQATEAV